MSATITEIAGPRAGLTAQKIEDEVYKKPLKKSSSISHDGKKNLVIEGLDFSQKYTGKALNLSSCENLVVRRCRFTGENLASVLLNIVGAKTKNVLVEYCIFEKTTTKLTNGAETLRIGVSPCSGCVFDVLVRKCIFREIASDPETISIKCVDVTIEDCFFANNKSNITTRHGGKVEISHNYFKGTGGIRVHGAGVTIGYNCFEDNPASTEPYESSPIIIRQGNTDKDPNWLNKTTPSGKLGKSHASYVQVLNLMIVGNEFKNCKKTILLNVGENKSKGITKKAVNVVQKDNEQVQKFTFETVVPPTTPPTTGLTCVIDGVTEGVKEVTYPLCAVDQPKVDAAVNALKTTPPPTVEPAPGV